MALKLSFDEASAIDKGQRRYQEDALISSFAEDQDHGLVVLSDGMGGHAAGDIASQIVVAEFHRTLTQSFDQSCTTDSDLAEALVRAAYEANACVKDHISKNPSTKGMGATLLATIVRDSSLHWVSIGDSPLFLYREGALFQLNEDHSLASQINFLVTSGFITQEEAASHPNRNVLTSAIIGGDIPKIDCPQTPTPLQDGDILITASDGLQSLPDHEIETALQTCASENSEHISRLLMARVLELGDAQQDNVSLSVIKAKLNAPVAAGPKLGRGVKNDCAIGYS